MHSSQSSIMGLLLAAGKSSRFVDAQGLQHDKLAMNLPHAVPPITVIECSARNLLMACPRSIAVLKPASAHAAAMQALGMTVVIAALAEQGMGESLAAGARAAMAQGAAGMIVMLADMPLIQPETIAAVARALLEGAKIVVPRFQRQQGHPVGFASTYLYEIASLSGDAGAKSLLKHHADNLTWLDLDDPGILLDVDTPEALLSVMANRAEFRQKHIALQSE